MANRISAFGYLECSAKTKEGVREVFEMATRAALQVRKRKKRSGCLLLWVAHTHTLHTSAKCSRNNINWRHRCTVFCISCTCDRDWRARKQPTCALKLHVCTQPCPAISDFPFPLAVYPPVSGRKIDQFDYVCVCTEILVSFFLSLLIPCCIQTSLLYVLFTYLEWPSFSWHLEINDQEYIYYSFKHFCVLLCGVVGLVGPCECFS